MMLVAVAFPLVVAAIAYGAGWATGLVGYKTPPHGFALNLGIAIVSGCTVGVVFAAGEEIGWRGYMLTRLIDAGVPRPLLASGIIWAVWHFPLILSGLYAAGPHPGISAGIFLVDVVRGAYGPRHCSTGRGTGSCKRASIRHPRAPVQRPGSGSPALSLRRYA